VAGGDADVFSDGELARLRGFLEITRAELVQYFTLTSPDEAFLRKFHGQGNVLGASVQLYALPWLGFASGEVTEVSAPAAGPLADLAGHPGGGVCPRLNMCHSDDQQRPELIKRAESLFSAGYQ
jgi:Domain of unknown function (DUF4158)